MWVYIICAYLLPLAVFLSRRVKEIPGALMGISFVILVSLYLERFITIVPFVWKEDSIPFSLLEILVTAGFAALFLLSWLAFVRILPVIPAARKRARVTQAQ
jgi:Ni/Fe-hydrogenase subunit HybB-like protein